MPLSKTEKYSESHWGNEFPKCPHCDFDIDISRFDLYQLYDNSDEHEIECPHCGEVMIVISTCNWIFETKYKEDKP